MHQWILLIRTFRTSFSEIASEINIFSCKEMHLKMLSAEVILSRPNAWELLSTRFVWILTRFLAVNLPPLLVWRVNKLEKYEKRFGNHWPKKMSRAVISNVPADCLASICIMASTESRITWGMRDNDIQRTNYQLVPYKSYSVIQNTNHILRKRWILAMVR